MGQIFCGHDIYRKLLYSLWSCAIWDMVIFYQTCIWNFCVLLAPRNKGQWRGKTRRGQNFGRLANQEHYRQQRDFSDRKDVHNQPQRRGAMPNRRPPSRGFLPTSSGSRKVIFFIYTQFNVAKCNLGEVKFQANAVSSLLLKRMWSLGWPAGAFAYLVTRVAFHTDLWGSAVKANLCGL